MNTSEQIAFNWLISNGRKEEDISFHRNKSPDFICKDGTKYEIKRLYGRIIIFYNKQLKDLEDTIIVVVNTEQNKVVSTFFYKDLDKQEMFSYTIVHFDKKIVLIPDDIHTELSLLKIEYKLKSISDVIEKLLKGEIKCSH